MGSSTEFTNRKTARDRYQNIVRALPDPVCFLTTEFPLVVNSVWATTKRIDGHSLLNINSDKDNILETQVKEICQKSETCRSVKKYIKVSKKRNRYSFTTLNRKY